jgi:hypothetical protein
MSARAYQLSGIGTANILIAIVVWFFGLAFTRQVVPFRGIGEILPWALAFGLQVALTIGQTNQRAIGWRNIRWPYAALMLVDVGLNAIGLLIATQTVQSSGDALLYVLRAVTTGDGAWQVAGSVAVGALIAALPEQLIRDAA